MASEARGAGARATPRGTRMPGGLAPVDLTTPSFKADPFPVYARLRAEDPVHRTHVKRWPVRVVTRYDDVLAVLKDRRLSNDWMSRTVLGRVAGTFTRSILTVDPPDHTRLRTLVHKAFGRGLVERMHTQVQRVCDDLLDVVAPAGRMDLVAAYALPLPLTMIADLMGIPAEDRPIVSRCCRRIFAVGSCGGAGDALKAVPSMLLFRRYVHRLFAQRRAHPQEDLITALVEARECGDKLSEDELLSMVALLLGAGYDTTVNLIASGALALLQHPEQRDRMLQNPAVAGTAIEELVRYTSPVDVSSPRLATEDLSIGAATVRRGELVLAALGSANHDESQFPDPEALDVARAPNKHLAFGGGVHFCLGGVLARMEAQIALTTLFRRLPGLRLAVPPESLRWRRDVILRGVEELPLAF
jgi:cytochrome P450